MLKQKDNLPGGIVKLNEEYILLNDKDLPNSKMGSISISSKESKYISCGEYDGMLYFYQPSNKIHTHLPKISVVKAEDVLYSIKYEEEK